jgi:hypothetical protein
MWGTLSTMEMWATSPPAKIKVKNPALTKGGLEQVQG